MSWQTTKGAPRFRVAQRRFTRSSDLKKPVHQILDENKDYRTSCGRFLRRSKWEVSWERVEDLARKCGECKWEK